MSATYEYCDGTVEQVETTPSREEILNISLKLGAEFAAWDTKQAHLNYFQNDLHKVCREELQNQPMAATAQRQESC